MPGLSASHALIFNEDLRKRFRIYMDAGELDMGHVFAFLSVEAAYSHGTEWLDQCLAYIQGNIDFVDEFLKNMHLKSRPFVRSFLFSLVGLP